MKWISRALSALAIEIGPGFTRCLKGKMPSHVLTDLSMLLSQNGISAGEIWLDGTGRIRFSREIPTHLHQRLRNIIVSG